jgi:DNA invertase Pin-like site-specific DNA recombinase/peptidoglycan hydrolase-like protein with peptidoglycan-binding domain
MTIHLGARRASRTRKLVVLMALIAIVAATLTAVAPAQASTSTTDHTTTPTLAQGAGMGDKPNPAVRRVQRVLDRRGYDLGPAGVDGRFGPYTDGAVRQLQSDRGLAADGIVGPRTNRALGLRQSTKSTREPGAKQSPSGNKSKNGKGTANAKPTAPAPLEGPAPAAPSRRAAHDGDSSSTGVSWVVALLVVIGSFLATLAAMALRSRRQAPRTGPATATTPAIAPIDAELYLEGTSANAAVGDFRGRAIATTIVPGPATDPGTGHTHYLVDDTRKPAPVWVGARDIRRSPTQLGAGERVIGYATVGADAPDHHADDPARSIAVAAEQAGWELVDVVTDRETGRGLSRPGLTYALSQIAEGKARGLVVSDLRLLSRSIVDLGALMEWIRDADAALVALDLGVDTSTPAGQEVAATLVTLGGWERERIARRTRSGLAEVRAQGGCTGRPAVSDRPELTERIAAMRRAGMTLQAIADQLNAEGVPTLRGGAQWRPSSVQAAVGYRRPAASRGPNLPPLEEERRS